MGIKLFALFLGLLVSCGLVALAVSSEPEFADGDVGLGLRFFRAADEVVEVFPDFQEKPITTHGTFLHGEFTHKGQQAIMFLGTDETAPRALNVLVFFMIETIDAEAFFDDALTDLRAVWGDVDEESPEAATAEEAEKITVQTVISGEATGIYRRIWNYERYYAMLMIGRIIDEPKKMAIGVQLLDRGANMPPVFMEGTVFYRNSKWCMSSEEVTAAEPETEFGDHYPILASKETEKLYNSYDGEIIYMFDADGLSVVAEFLYAPEDRSACSEMFADIRAQIVEQYGVVGTDEVYFDDEYYASLEDALNEGGVSYFTDFSLGDTQIVMILIILPTETNFFVQYRYAPH